MIRFCHWLFETKVMDCESFFTKQTSIVCLSLSWAWQLTWKIIDGKEACRFSVFVHSVHTWSSLTICHHRPIKPIQSGIYQRLADKIWNLFQIGTKNPESLAQRNATVGYDSITESIISWYFSYISKLWTHTCVGRLKKVEDDGRVWVVENGFSSSFPLVELHRYFFGYDLWYIRFEILLVSNAIKYFAGIPLL